MWSPYKTPFFRLFFSNTVHMKAWLTTADGGTHLWKTAFPARRPPLSPAASLVRAGGHSAHCAGRLPLHLQARFRDKRCPRLYSLVVGRLFLRCLFRQSPHSPHKRLPRLGAAHGGRGAVRHSYGVVAHFGVLVVRNPRCEPIGYPTGCRMLNEEPAQSQDLQMMGMLLPLGIEKGKD